jgi:hypothetical protein
VLLSNCWPSVVKLSFNDAAAKTVTVPDSLSGGAFDVPAEPDDDESAEEEQALRASSAATPAPLARRARRLRRALRVAAVIKVCSLSSCGASRDATSQAVRPG